MNNDFDEQKNKQAVKCLTIGHFMIDSYAGFLAPILPFIASKISISLTLAGSVISISHLLSSMTQPFFGFLADKIKKRFFIFWGMLLACVFLSMTGIAQNYWQLVLFLVLGSLGSGFYHPQSTGFINYFSSKDISKNMALFIAMGTIGYSIGPLVSSTITAIFSLEDLPFMAIFGVLMAICVFKFVPKVSLIPTKEPISKINFWEATKLILNHKTLLILITISMLKSLIAQSYCIFLPFLWKDMGYSVSNIGIALFLFSFCGGIATYLSSKIERLIGHKKVFYISMMSVMPLTFLFALTYKNMPLISLVLFIAVGFAAMLSTSVNMTLAQNSMKEYKSMISGYIGGFSWGVTGVLFTPLGFLAEKIGIIHLLILISIIPFICSYWVKFLPDETDAQVIFL